MSIDWRRPLIYTHRWLGIAGGLVFIAWFASGIVMMYARMPELTDEERLARLAPIELTHARVSIAEAARNAAACGTGGRACDRVRIAMLGDRLVYRVQSRGAWTTIFADTGEPFRGLTADQALDLARRFAPECASTLRYDALITEPDQWTLSGDARRGLPLHRIALGDSDGSEIYISNRTGDFVMKTTSAARRWAYAGAVLHWIYFTPLRKHGELWTQVIICGSLVGGVMCLTGLFWGVFRFSPSARFRLQREHSHTPYAGFMRWHHYAGLIVGLASFTWVFSGMLSMDPIPSIPGTGPTRDQRDAISGGPLRLEAMTIDRVRTEVGDVVVGGPERAARRVPGAPPSPASGAQPLPASGAQPSPVSVAQPFTAAREVEIAQFRGEPFLIAHDAPVRFDRDTLIAAARAAMPNTEIADTAWLDAYDAYYYDRSGALSLPVLRVRYADPPRTWLYLDPRRGAIVRKEERLTRVNRWLYHGLHSLDFPFLYYRRPLWDIVVITLSLGGLVLSAATLVPAVRRLRRHVRRVQAGGRYAFRTDDRVRGRVVDRTRRGGIGGVM
jgi:hypothetical protein